MNTNTHTHTPLQAPADQVISTDRSLEAFVRMLRRRATPQAPTAQAAKGAKGSGPGTKAGGASASKRPLAAQDKPQPAAKRPATQQPSTTGPKKTPAAAAGGGGSGLAAGLAAIASRTAPAAGETG